MPITSSGTGEVAYLLESMAAFDLFLSYGRQDDEPFVKRLYEDLTARGWKIWWDRVCMPNRALTFLQEIRDAIDQSERLIAVVGPNAAASDYVRAEWEHALLFAKGVIPVLRAGAFELLPPEVGLYHGPDFRNERPYDAALEELLRLLAEPVAPLAPLRTLVPALPPHFVPPRADLDWLLDKVLADIRRPEVVASGRQTVVVHGMSGAGKSVVATAFARLAEVRRAASDGVVWLGVGDRPNLLALVMRLARAFGAPEAALEAAGSEQDRLRMALDRLPGILEDKSCLIVLDDVWRADDASPIRDALGPRCRMLVTTQDASLSTALGAPGRSLAILSDTASRKLLADWAGCAIDGMPPEATEVIRICGGLPLALALCGAQVRDGLAWTDLGGALREADLSYLDHAYGSVEKSLRISIDALGRADETAARQYLELAVFPPEPVPEAAVLTLWLRGGNGKERDARKLVTRLAGRALLSQNEERQLSLHPLQRAFLRESAGGLANIHAELLSAYRQKCPSGAWADVPDDGYVLKRLAYHLVAAGRLDELRGLLRCIELSAAFEGAKFDTVIAPITSTSVEWGLMMFSFHNGSLVRLVLDLFDNYPELVQRAFGELTAEFLQVIRGSRAEQADWTSRLRLGGHRVKEPWNSAFERLGKDPVAQTFQLRHAYEEYMLPAVRLAQRHQLRSAQTIALLFDICVQNGPGKARAALEAAGDGDEAAVRMRIAEGVSERTLARFREYVRPRKLAIANGEGVVHGRRYVLADWGILDEPWGGRAS